MFNLYCSESYKFVLVGLLIVVNKFHLVSEIKKYLVRLIFSYMFSEIAVVATLT